MAVTTRNRAPLATLIGAAPADDGPQDRTSPEYYVGIIADVRDAAEKTNPKYGAVAHAAEFIDVVHMTKEQQDHLVAAVRAANKRETRHTSDIALLDDLCDVDFADAVRGTHIILYDSQKMAVLSPLAARANFAHEIGHHILGRYSMHPEKGADKIAAEIVGPQPVVDWLAELAIIYPPSNDVAFQKKWDRNGHRTDYERAVQIQKEFPKEKIDLSYFPRPTNEHKKPHTGSPEIGPSIAPAPAPPGF